MKRHYKKTPQAVPHILTSVAFLLVWFLLFISILFAFIRATYSPALLAGLYDNITLIVSFYAVVSVLVILFAVWFTSRFYRE